MRKYAVSLLSALLFASCSRQNTDHCKYSDMKCSDSTMICIYETGYCGSVEPLVITKIDPSVPDPSNPTTVTVTGTGFVSIDNLTIDGTEITDFQVVNTNTLKFDSRKIPAKSKCGPYALTINRNATAPVTAEEKIGRRFANWKYQMPYSLSASANLTGVVDFAFSNFDKVAFDGIYYTNKRVVGALYNGPLKPLTAGAMHSLDSKIGLINSGVDASPKKIFTLHNNALLTVGFLSDTTSMATDVVLATLCDVDRRLIDQKPLNSSMAKRLILACAGVANPSFLNVRQFDLSPRTPGSSLSNSQFTKPVRAVSYAPNDSDCGIALLSAADGVPPNIMAPVCANSNTVNAPEKPIEITLASAMESVASVNARDGSTSTSRHYVLRKNGDSLVMEVVDASRMQGGVPGLVPAPVTPIVFNSKDIGSFLGSGAKIEVNDLNCDNFPDVIVKTDTRVIAYLGIDAASWEATPKVLFEMPSTAPGVTIKKAALWIPDYSSPPALGVLGILDSNSNLSLYQQQ
jgi:hypothetical protein